MIENMSRPRREDRFEKVKLVCIVCGKEFLREKYIEESRIQKGTRGPCCGPVCSGRLGWEIKSQEL